MKKKRLVLSFLVLMTTCVYGQKAVDLGLSVKWADCNVGASSPQQVGNYYAWGETKTKQVYSWETYSLGSNVSTCRNIGENICGTKYDAARENLGEGWRMPTAKEIKELINNCTYVQAVVSGVKGVRFTGKNGNSIFLPLTGYKYKEVEERTRVGLFISGNEAVKHKGHALGLVITSNGEVAVGDNFDRYEGYVIRPVRPK